MGGSSIGSGLWTSDDSGATWKHLGWSHVKCYSVAVVDSSFGKTLYLACGNGLMRSTDAGLHWRMLTDWRIAEVMDVAVDQRSPAKLTIATATGLWTSADSGGYWQELGPREFRAHLFYDSSGSKVTEQNACRLADGRVGTLTGEGGVLAGGKQIVRPLQKRGGLWTIGAVPGTLYIGGERGVYHIDSANVTHLIPASPRNAHGIATIGSDLYVCALSGGVWKAEKGKQETEFEELGLHTLQLWSLHTSFVHE